MTASKKVTNRVKKKGPTWLESSRLSDEVLLKKREKGRADFEAQKGYVLQMKSKVELKDGMERKSDVRFHGHRDRGGVIIVRLMSGIRALLEPNPGEGVPGSPPPPPSP
ncbi:hypothetical protein CEXT_706171 [Caerostris extrusa]|uniref:Uncharacterized protein n=1 Tax=Caerostris extrusa TaxID=172846 RepID=A0AAV4XGB6_CAEEX|nr:hypothetical protein CEXT_706171 [Caerostris extrusa]